MTRPETIVFLGFISIFALAGVGAGFAAIQIMRGAM